MQEYIPVFTLSVLALLTFCFLLKEKPIDSNNTLFFAAIIIILYIVGVLCLTPKDLGDKVVTGLISISSALVGFISHGVIKSTKRKNEKEDKSEKSKSTNNVKE